MFTRNRNRELRKRYMEMAAMLKEIGHGSIDQLDKVKHKFALQEGVRMDRATEYLDTLEGAGLIVFAQGDKTWKYNEDAEWELFKVNI